PGARRRPGGAMSRLRPLVPPDRRRGEPARQAVLDLRADVPLLQPPDGARRRGELGAGDGGGSMSAKPQAATVLLAGAGNIGSHLAPLLARAGVGVLRIVDRDTVEEKN